MSNPLQPKCIKILEDEFKAYVIKVTSASKSGHMDIIACIEGQFFGFEVKWGSDVPSLLQKQKINACLEAKGKAFFVRSLDELRQMVNGEIKPIQYSLGQKYSL